MTKLVFNPNIDDIYDRLFENNDDLTWLEDYSSEEPTGKKVIMKAHTHYVFKIQPLYTTFVVPKGYFILHKEDHDMLRMSDVLGDPKNNKTGIEYTLLNKVDVEVEEYQDKYTGELVYPYVGKPVEKHNVKTFLKSINNM